MTSSKVLRNKSTPRPKVSIIVVNYNGYSYLQRTIPALLALSYLNREIIVVDNGSTDGSIELLLKYQQIQLIKCPVLRAKNNACNLGVSQASGDYLLLLDNDLLITDRKLIEKLITQAAPITNLGAIGLAFYNQNDRQSQNYGGFFSSYFIRENKPVPLSHLTLLHNTPIGFPMGAAIFLPKKRWQEFGGYDQLFPFGGDDTDLGISMWLGGYRNVLFAQTLQIHLGLPERQDPIKYSWKLQYALAAQMATIIKNYTATNLFITILCFSLFAGAKSVKQALVHRSFSVLLALFNGYWLLLSNLRPIVTKRKEAQEKRAIPNDRFLTISPPKQTSPKDNKYR